MLCCGTGSGGRVGNRLPMTRGVSRTDVSGCVPACACPTAHTPCSPRTPRAWGLGKSCQVWGHGQVTHRHLIPGAMTEQPKGFTGDEGDWGSSHSTWSGGGRGQWQGPQQEAGAGRPWLTSNLTRAPGASLLFPVGLKRHLNVVVGTTGSDMALSSPHHLRGERGVTEPWASTSVFCLLHGLVLQR